MSLQITPWPTTTIIHALILLFLWLTIFYTCSSPSVMCHVYYHFSVNDQQQLVEILQYLLGLIGIFFLAAVYPRLVRFHELGQLCKALWWNGECFIQSMVLRVRFTYFDHLECEIIT
jgi:hypothetical protein